MLECVDLPCAGLFATTHSVRGEVVYLESSSNTGAIADQPAALGHGFQRRISALTSPMWIPSRDIDWEDCDFEGAYFRITASWRSAAPTEVPSLTVELGGSISIGTRMVVNE